MVEPFAFLCSVLLMRAAGDCSILTVAEVVPEVIEVVVVKLRTILEIVAQWVLDRINWI